MLILEWLMSIQSQVFCQEWSGTKSFIIFQILFPETRPLFVCVKNTQNMWNKNVCTHTLWANVATALPYAGTGGCSHSVSHRIS